MPTVRRKRFDRGRRDVLDMNQRSYLQHGTSFWSHFPGQREFEDEEHARAAWARHREDIMASFTMGPGRRPWGFWRFDMDLPIVGARRDFDWSRLGAESESSAVHLAISTSHAERLEIEEHWLRLIEVSQFKGGPVYACEWGGCPEAFYRDHVGEIRERQEESARRSREGLR